MDIEMKFELLDYSAIYFKSISKTNIPEKRSGKFIQIENEDDEKEYLILSPKELSIFHANIAERFCMINKISGSYNARKDFFEIHDLDWTVIGGGLWVIDDNATSLNLFDKSTMYGKFDSRDLKKKISTVKKLKDYSILIDGL